MRWQGRALQVAKPSAPAQVGRYRLSFDLAAPEVSTFECTLPYRDGVREDEAVRAVLADAQLAAAVQSLPLEPTADGVRCASTDVDHADLRCLRYALVQLAPLVAPATLFCFSTGDDPSEWVDRYVFVEGTVQLQQYTAPTEDLWSDIPSLYEQLVASGERHLLGLARTTLHERATLMVRGCRAQPPWSARESQCWALHDALLARAKRLDAMSS